jgi:RNA polymerase sigma factor (sigma-70 family)
LLLLLALIEYIISQILKLIEALLRNINALTKAFQHADTNSISYSVAADVISVFNGLSPEDKRLLNLRFKEDLTGKALAEVLNTTENNASQRVHRALKKLRFKLSGEPSVWVPDRKEEHKDMYQ